MSYRRESLSQIKHRITKTLDQENIPFSFKSLLATALSGLAHMLHGHIDYLALEMLPDSAKGELLERWASIWGLRRGEPTATTLKIRVLKEAGAQTPKEWMVGGEEFNLAEDDDNFCEINALKQGPLALKDLEAVVKTTTAGVTSRAAIIELIDGKPAETDESLRRRLLQHVQTPPQGGSYRDYINWAEAVPGVRKAWVKPSYLIGPSGSPGHVEVTFLEAGTSQTKEKRRLIQESLEQLAPAHARISVVGLIRKPVPIRFSVNPDTPEMRLKVIKEVTKFFAEESQPGGFLDTQRKKTPSELSRSRLSAAISAIEGEISHELFQPNLEDLQVGDCEILIPDFGGNA